VNSVDDFRSLTGRSVGGTVKGRSVRLANRQLMQESGIEFETLIEPAEALRSDGQMVVLVAIDGMIAGLIGVADPIKESTPKALEALHEEGVQVGMLTGDSRTTAAAVARKLGIDRVEAEVLPEQKTGVVKQPRGNGGRRH